MPKVTPDKLLSVSWHWSHNHTPEEAAYDAEVDRNTVGRIYGHLRDIVTAFMAKLTGGILIGSPEKPVCVDETVITKKKKNRGGFRGKHTLGPMSHHLY